MHTHSGYDFYGMPSSLSHDFHHAAFNNNFGVTGILDRLHNTDIQYQQWLVEHKCRLNKKGEC